MMVRRYRWRIGSPETGTKSEQNLHNFSDHFLSFVLFCKKGLLQKITKQTKRDSGEMSAADWLTQEVKQIERKFLKLFRSFASFVFFCKNTPHKRPRSKRSARVTRTEILFPRGGRRCIVVLPMKKEAILAKFKAEKVIALIRADSPDGLLDCAKALAA